MQAIGRMLQADREDLTLGTAFAISRSLAATAFHCLADGPKVVHRRVTLAFLTDDRVEATYLDGDTRGDVALLSLSAALPHNLSPLPVVDGVIAYQRWRSQGFPPGMRSRGYWVHGVV